MSETARPVCAAHVASRGPRFFRGADDALMFEITLDHRSKIGPRLATEEDSRDYPKAWDTFTTGEQSAAEPIKPMIEAVDHPGAKAEHDQEKADRQRKMDARRSGGI